MSNLLTVRDIATRLRVSTWTIRRWCNRGSIPFLKFEGAVRFEPSQIENWLTRKGSNPQNRERRYTKQTTS